MSTAVLSLQGVVKHYGAARVVDELSLSLAPGDVYALLGPNGAGKTTTLNLILGFIAADAGTIQVNGIDVAADPLTARSRLAYLPETVMLHPALTALENLDYFAMLAGHRLQRAQARALLHEAGLQDNAFERRCSGFSKGMRQKVGVAIALAKQAQVLLLDEPTSGLDAAAANDLSALVRAAAGRGVAVLMATHDLLRVRDVAQRVGILRAGRLLLERDAAGLSPYELEQLYLREMAA